MTDPINPWLDPIEVRRLAERLMMPDHATPMAETDAGFGEEFVGYATGQIAALSSINPPPAQQLPDEEPAAPVHPHPQLFESHPLAHGPFLERITRFCDWMRQKFSATGIFILDREGAVIFDESGHGRLHFLARSFVLASRRPSASRGNVHIKIGVGILLEVIPVESSYGHLVLGAVVPTPLDSTSVKEVTEALSLVASPPVES